MAEQFKTYFDKENKFHELFSPNSGLYFRSGIIDENKGIDTGVDPFMRNYPALLDIGIMGRCHTASICEVGCYQQGGDNRVGKHMTLETFQSIIQEISGKTFEIALGGFGSPNNHPDFEEMVKYARDNGVIPNYTTSGLALSIREIEATKKYCGAVAVSWHNRRYTEDSIMSFIGSGCKTNIHFVLGNDSIDQAIKILKHSSWWFGGLNAMIFLLYKPVGMVKNNNVLSADDPRVSEFYSLIDKEHPFKVGLDACHMPGVTNFSKNVSPISTTACDAARFSMYITHDRFALPCSFDVTTRNWAVDLTECSIEEAWKGKLFSEFRKYHRNSCSKCETRKDCMGGCPLMGKQINLCKKKERSYYEN